MPTSLKDDGYQITEKHCFCIEFRLGKQRRGFHSNHLIGYTLEENPDAKDDPSTPPGKFALAFSTADVILSGWRLGQLADALRDNALAAVSAAPQTLRRPRLHQATRRLHCYHTNRQIAGASAA